MNPTRRKHIVQGSPPSQKKTSRETLSVKQANNKKKVGSLFDKLKIGRKKFHFKKLPPEQGKTKDEGTKESKTDDNDHEPTHEEEDQKAPHPGCRRVIPTIKDCRSPPPEETTASTEHIGEIKKLIEDGKTVVEYEKIKEVAKEFALHAAKLTPKGAVEEYQTELKKFIPSGMTKQNFEKNHPKNRYKDVICCDQERVKLKDSAGTCCGDYIHANHVRGPPLNPNQHFILTQGPTPYTVSDFWRMVKQENVQQIIMLCETVETKKPKCLQYWPLFDNDIMKLTDANLVVTNKGRYLHCPGTTTSVLELKDTRNEQAINLFHHQWKLWPDRSVPDNPDGLLKLLQMARACPQGHSVIIHCSAGIGRTGTIMAAEMGIQTFLQNRTPNVLQIVRALREKRAQCVQTDLQYAFIFKILLCWLEKLNPDAETTKALEDFFEGFQNIVQALRFKEKSGLKDATDKNRKGTPRITSLEKTQGGYLETRNQANCANSLPTCL
ncbi:unnamed protein product [Bursaphelenchus xylophilus]|uniref:(pine wood nematode) hypothetical protein n=1 Tax=Bursaphelenchus xylophilus TaxID=6326 RepID=A0A1I7RSH9_BURXY|nr:unnamed protein product [Bursaphelenchus xylophilus]CAG9122932.1 unnamed protein product [Bursaphelenchus xylophilus]